MKPFSDFNSKLDILFTDIDDTLTTDGRLPAQSYEMLWKLQNAGVAVVPVTGRPAGWCEMIARLWPVLGVVGENGALAFQYKNKKMHRTFIVDEDTRLNNAQKLQTIRDEVLHSVPGAAVASDQFTRLFDLAIDFCEDVPPLDKKAIAQIVAIFEKHGATAKVSSIHVNGWFGDYDKRSMCETFYENNFSKKLSDNLESAGFVGDSPNDEPLFAFFENSFAVANILEFKNELATLPRFVASEKGGLGFVQIGQQILHCR